MTPGTVAYQAPQFMGFPNNYWSGLGYSFQGISDPGIEPSSSCIGVAGSLPCTTWAPLVASSSLRELGVMKIRKLFSPACPPLSQDPVLGFSCQVSLVSLSLNSLLSLFVFHDL